MKDLGPDGSTADIQAPPMTTIDNLGPDGSTADIQAPPMTKIDKILMAFVIAAIIAVIVFQIVDYTQGQANPVINIDSNVTTPRKFPGILVCPFSVMQNWASYRAGDECPLWQRDAVLSFDAAFNAGIAPDFMTLANSNVDAGSKRQDKNVCPGNNGLFTTNTKREAGFLFFENSMVSGGLTPTDSQTYRKVLIQNTSPPKIREGKACSSWTPPNVECWMFDPRHFKLDSKCNPMSEVRANSQDSLLLKFPGPAMYAFQYTGLTPQPATVFFNNVPEKLSLWGSQLNTMTAQLNYETSIFGGVVAVLYDASKSPPTSLNFDGALTNYLIIPADTNSTGTSGAVVVDNAMASIVLTSTACFVNGDSDDRNQKCIQRRTDPLLAVVTQEFDFFLNKDVSTKQSVSISKSSIDQLRFSAYNLDEFGADVSIMFSSSVSVGRYQVSKVSLSTTLSIIVSTAATLWGSQEKIKEFIEKAQLFLAKRRASA